MADQTANSAKTHWKLAPVLAAALLLGACGGLKTHAQILSENAEAYIAAHPELSQDKKQAIRRATLVEGMSKREVIAAWGRPAAVRKYRQGRDEWWYFGCDWPHTCIIPDEDGGLSVFFTVDEYFQSQALFREGRLVEWRS